MSLIEHYRLLYRYEQDCNQKMLTMLESVPEPRRADPRFQRAAVLVDHLAAVRERWLVYMGGAGGKESAWWNEQPQLDTLRPRFAELERAWTDYLADLDEERFGRQFEFTEANGEVFRIPIAVQIVQLAGHADYHRGQVALLVDQLGGETVDTDYADWCWMEHNR